MRIDVVESISDLEKIRSNWDRVYLSDPNAEYFLSWSWLHSYLLRRRRWFILALRENEPGSPYVAFLPLRLITNHDPKTGLYTDDIILAGSPSADYAGIIAEPQYEHRAVEGFSLYLRDQNWTNIHLSYVCGPLERRNAILRALGGPEVGIRIISKIDENNIDQAVCPYVDLPDRWDDYLDTKLSSQTRQKMRRFLRQVENDDDFRITVATAETIDRDMDILFRLWREKWARHKGDRTDSIVASAREMLMDAFRRDALLLPVLWHRDRPLGAIANMLDHQKKTVLFYITGRDETWKTPSPGLVLHGYAIRRAIAEGFRTYDFLRGNEAYKYAFGVEERPLHCATVKTVTGRNLRDRLNVRSIGYVFERAKTHYKNGEKAMAEVAFQQVVATNPDHQGARFGLAQLLYDKGRLVEAEAAFKSILEKITDPLPVLPHLGDTQLALKKFADAAATFALLAEGQPNSSEALYKQGVALVAGQQKKKAIKIFQALEALNSDNPSHADFRKKARDVLAKLIPAALPELKLPAIHPSGFPLAAADLPAVVGKVIEERQIKPALSSAAATALSTSRLNSEFAFARHVGAGTSNWRTKH